MKALDIYLAFCFVMVFGALLEYATVSYTGKRIKLNQRRFEEFKKKVRIILNKKMPQSGVGSMQGKNTGNMPSAGCASSINKSLDPTPI